MHEVYNFVAGPMAWLAFLLFIGGSLFRLGRMLYLIAKKERFIFTYMSWKYSLRSILHWLTPFGTANWKLHPLLTIVTFTFHICLLVTPLFLLAHIILWEEAWNLSWWAIPDGVADIMTVVVILSCLFFLVRRLREPEVRFVTTAELGFADGPGPFIDFRGGIQRIDRGSEAHADAIGQDESRELAVVPADRSQHAAHVLFPGRSEARCLICVTGNMRDRAWQVEQQARAGQSACVDELHKPVLVCVLTSDANTAFIADDLEIAIERKIIRLRQLDRDRHLGPGFLDMRSRVEIDDLLPRAFDVVTQYEDEITRIRHFEGPGRCFLFVSNHLNRIHVDAFFE